MPSPTAVQRTTFKENQRDVVSARSALLFCAHLVQCPLRVAGKNIQALPHVDPHGSKVAGGQHCQVSVLHVIGLSLPLNPCWGPCQGQLDVIPHHLQPTLLLMQVSIAVDQEEVYLLMSSELAFRDIMTPLRGTDGILGTLSA